MDSSCVTITDEAGVRTISFHRPAQRNALTPAMLEALIDGLAVGSDARSTVVISGGTPDPLPIRCVLVRGEGTVFCAGFDLSLCRDSTDGRVMRSLLTNLDKAARAMRACPVPVVVACQGAAIAGGCALVAASDITVADRQAKLGYPVVLLGISPAVSAPTLVPRIGFGQARSRLLDPSLITGEEALAIGLVHEVVEDAQAVEAKARAIAGDLASKPPKALAATKVWLNRLDSLPTVCPERASDIDALGVSLALTGGPEEQACLARYWNHARK